MTTDQHTPTDPDEDDPAARGCHRVGCSFEVVTAHAHGPIAIVCTGTCGRSWPVGPAEEVAGYLAVAVRGTEATLWSSGQVRATPAEAHADRDFWAASHAAMKRGITLRTAKVVYIEATG